MKSNFTQRVSTFNFVNGMKLLLLCATIALSNNKLLAQTFPSNFNPQIFMSGWTDVEGFRFDATGQMYVWEKAGKVWVVDTNGTKISLPLLNISEEVGGWRDHGLNGFALDPNFRTNGYYYLFYTVDRHHLLYYGTLNYNATTNTYLNATISRVTRYTANIATNFTTTVAGSRLVLLGENKKTGVPLLHESHSGGQLVFGTDGSLLVSTGDGASYNLADGGSASGTYYSQALADTIITAKENVGAFRSQLVDCLNGKILRINPATGDGLPTNPYYDGANPRSAKSRVWCLGLRNPFRMTLKPGSGSTDITAGNPGVLYIGDVGWSAFEDLNVATGPGMNFGWPLFEGLTPMSSYQALTVYNQDAPNPLYLTGGCTQQYFQFKQLCIQDTLTTNPSWPNPCNTSQQIPSTLLRYKHARPAVDWQHGTAHARTGTWNGTSASQVDLNNVASPVPGPVFAGNAAVGGAWYTGTKYPVIYQNTYFNGDYGAGWIKNFKFKPDNTPDSVKDFGSNLGAVVFVEYNPKNQLLYYVKYPSDIYKLTYTATINQPPTAVASMNVYYGSKPLAVNFKGDSSSDPENLPLTYSWNFGDGSPTSSLMNPSYIYNPVTSLPVNYTATLTVSDNLGQTSTTSLIVYVNNTPPQVTITSFNDNDLFTMSHATVLPLEASVTDAESPDSLLSYTWITSLHHNNHEHPEAPDNDKITYTVLTPVGCDGNIYYYRMQLTVTDPSGLSTTVDGKLYPACDAPVASFISNTKGCKGVAVNFTDQSSNLPDSLRWSFPGGNPSTSAAKNPSVVYNVTGTYNVSLIATSSRGSDTLTKSAYINIAKPPVASVAPAIIDSMCATGIKLLKANTGTNLTYQWTNDGLDIIGANNANYNATGVGTYRVRVTDTLKGCAAVSTKSEKIVIRPLGAAITAAGATTFCNGDSVVLISNAGSFKYQWRKNGVLITGATAINYSAKAGGNYTVRLIDAGACKAFSNAIKVIVNCRESEDIKSEAFAVEVYPNPAFADAMLKVSIPQKGNINIKIFNTLGQVVSTFENIEITDEGEYEFNLHTSTFDPGIYFIKACNGEQTKSLKLVVVNK
ncbi:MAG: PKD domain-containing protein [Bacteroidia bacterium]